MQTVCDKKYFGVFTEIAECPEQAINRFKPLPKHERLLALQLFIGGLVVSGFMLAAIFLFGL